MTEAAEKVGLKPETLLAHAMHIAAANAAFEEALRGRSAVPTVERLCRT